MENNRPLNDMLATTIQQIRDTVDANTVVGEPIMVGEVTLIPISKISFGFGTGGSEFPAKAAASKANPYGGGGGAGVKITPVCFLSVVGTNVRVLPVASPVEGSVDRAVEMIPDILNKVGEFLDKKKEKSVDTI